MSTKPTIATESFKIEGMTCINCALNLERSVKKAGIDQVHVNFASKELLFERPENVNDELISKAIQDAGFSIAKDNKITKWFEKVLLAYSFIIAIYFMLIMFLPFHVHPILDAVLAGVSLLIGFYKFGKGAFFSIKSGSANMYVLILLGGTTAFFFSLYLMLFKAGQHLYFETTAVLVALVLIGDILEDNAVKKTVSSISNLAKNKVSLAKKIVNSTIEMVSTNSLKVGDLVQGNLGDEIHTDAKVIEGTALIDEALITGESIPISKNVGDLLLGGSSIVDGNISYEVSKNAHLSTKAKIDSLVQKASGQKASVQKLADKISAIFVPLVLVITLVSFLVNYFALGVGLEDAVLRSIAILVISCPCAMGLATPISVIVGLGKMSKEGILVKNPDAFENLANLNQIIFDKTGTLSTGKFGVKELSVHGIAKEEAQGIIKTMERKSSHPIAKSLVTFYADVEDSLELNTIEEVKGEGMIAQSVSGDSYILGSASFTKQNKSVGDLFLLKNDVLVAHVRIEDELKENVKSTLDYFKNSNVKNLVLSGDKKEKCDALSEKLQTEIIGELKPEDKLALISKMEGQNVAMLGDGVNDAPSLAIVNVGISFADASNMAMQTADVILMRDDMNALVKAHKIAKLTYRTIKQNLFWAFAYNLVAIPLAAFGIINPMFAAFFMIFSDLIVVGNAFVLKGRKI
ncbi:MAG: Cu+-exporting ATPase [Chitinophagales bacterium]|jgi:Cu+-exporting ATPase